MSSVSIFLIMAHSMMKNNPDTPPAIANCQKTVRKYFAECLAGSSESYSLEASSSELVKATLKLVFLYCDVDDDQVEDALEIAGVETDVTLGSIADKVKLNRFSGIDTDE